MKARVLLAALLLSLLPIVSSGQAKSNYVVRPLLSKYNLNATTETYAILDQTDTTVIDRVKTSGLVTTVTDFTGNGAPFASIAENTRVIFMGPAGVFVRTVVGVASSTSMTVETAVDLSATGGYKMAYRNTTVDPSAAGGWFKTDNLVDTKLTIIITQMDVVGGIDFRLMCASDDQQEQPVQWYPALTPPTPPPTYLNAPSNTPTQFTITGFSGSRCRVGMKIHTNDDGVDTGVHREEITMFLEGRSFAQ